MPEESENMTIECVDAAVGSRRVAAIFCGFVYFAGCYVSIFSPIDVNIRISGVKRISLQLSLCRSGSDLS